MNFVSTPAATRWIKAASSRSGSKTGGLVAQSLANTPLEILPEANDKFFYKAFAAQCTFVRGADGEIAGLVVHEDGFEKPGRRISEASARELQARLKARIGTKQPFEGSRQILGKLISEAQSGEVDWTTKSEEFRLISEPQVAGIKAWMVKLGELRSIVFSGVNASGWDIYHVSFANGLLEWSFFLDRNGKLRGEWMRDLPTA